MNSKFIKPIKSFTLAEIVNCINAKVVGEANVNTLIEDVADLKCATNKQISFISSSSYVNALKTTTAYAVIVSSKVAEKESGCKTPFLIVKDPYIAFAEVMQLFYPNETYQEYISQIATISNSAVMGKNCHVSDGVWLGENVILGNNVYIGPNSVINNNVKIGNNTIIHSSVSIKYASIGENCIIHDGARIGQDGFGFAPNYNNAHVKIPQVGGVIIENNVEIGANTCIDRGALNNTIIKSGTKIDNLVQIGHNVQIGKNCFLGGQVGISGSTIIEDKVAIAGQSGLAPHIKIEEGAQIAPKSGVFRNIAKNNTVMGIPARSFFEGMRLEAILNQLLKNNKTKNR